MFSRARIIAAALLVASLTPMTAQTPPSPARLADLRDQYRPLLLFAPSPDDPSLLAQMTRLQDHQPGLHERDILVIAVPYQNPSPTEVALSPPEAEAARRRFHVPPGDFTAILLGKDGGEKLRSGKPISFEKLRDKVDSMPMRKQEMRSTGSPPHPQ